MFNRYLQKKTTVFYSLIYKSTSNSDHNDLNISFVDWKNESLKSNVQSIIKLTQKSSEKFSTLVDSLLSYEHIHEEK